MMGKKDMMNANGNGKDIGRREWYLFCIMNKTQLNDEPMAHSLWYDD